MSMSRIFFAYFFFFQLFFLLSLGCWFISYLNLRFCFSEQANRELVQTLCAIWCMVFCQEYNLKHDSQKKALSIKKQRKLLCRNSTKQLPKFLIWGISIKALRPRSKIFSKQYGKTFDSKILQRSTIWQSRQHPAFRQQSWQSRQHTRHSGNRSDRTGSARHSGNRAREPAQHSDNR